MHKKTTTTKNLLKNFKEKFICKWIEGKVTIEYIAHDLMSKFELNKNLSWWT